MKKTILNLGRELNKAQQKSVYGGGKGTGDHGMCLFKTDCPPPMACTGGNVFDGHGNVIDSIYGYCVDIVFD